MLNTECVGAMFQSLDELSRFVALGYEEGESRCHKKEMQP